MLCNRVDLPRKPGVGVGIPGGKREVIVVVVLGLLLVVLVIVLLGLLRCVLVSILLLLSLVLSLGVLVLLVGPFNLLLVVT